MKSSSRSSFRAIKDEITQRIGDRRWQPGSLIPGEETLAAEFGAARATVNRALQELARAGLIERKRKVGTRVALNPIREARFSIPLVAQEVAATGATYRYHLIFREKRKASADDAERLGIEAGGLVLHLRCLHFSDERPYQFEDRLINPEIAPRVLEENFDTQGPNEWLVAAAPFSRAEFTFLAGLPSEEEARFLEVDPQAPVFIGERRTWLLTQPITAVRMVHPQTHRLRTTL
ncbi:MAG: UTRA domain-containing protein [Rhizobiales bacterium]|nr:UTRA domain-containing protein [Hyphomicrobiales bacterium]